MAAATAEANHAQEEAEDAQGARHHSACLAGRDNAAGNRHGATGRGVGAFGQLARPEEHRGYDDQQQRHRRCRAQLGRERRQERCNRATAGESPAARLQLPP